jgi:long-chain acyl-CoA synthetase
LSITGRRKNILITSYGRNVSPEWVESVLLSQPEIAQAIVYGDAQPHLSALIVPSSPRADIGAAVARVNEKLPDYARIKKFRDVPPSAVHGAGRIPDRHGQAAPRSHHQTLREGQGHELL